MGETGLPRREARRIRAAGDGAPPRWRIGLTCLELWIWNVDTFSPSSFDTTFYLVVQAGLELSILPQSHKC